MADLR